MGQRIGPRDRVGVDHRDEISAWARGSRPTHSLRMAALPEGSSSRRRQSGAQFRAVGKGFNASANPAGPLASIRLANAALSVGSAPGHRRRFAEHTQLFDLRRN